MYLKILHHKAKIIMLNKFIFIGVMQMIILMDQNIYLKDDHIHLKLI